MTANAAEKLKRIAHTTAGICVLARVSARCKDLGAGAKHDAEIIKSIRMQICVNQSLDIW